MMCENDDLEPVDIDLDDAGTMALIEEMRNAEPSEEAQRKIKQHKYARSQVENRRAANRRYKAKHADKIKADAHEYFQRPEVKARRNEQFRVKYHTDPEYREKKLAENRARRRARAEAMTEEQRAEQRKKRAEYNRKWLAKKRAKEAKLEANRKRAREYKREQRAAWTPEQLEEHKRKQRAYEREWKARKDAENE